MKYWISKGAPKSKLVVGIPTYGRSWTLTSSATDIGSPASGGGSGGIYTGEPGILGFNEICLNVRNNGWNVVKDPLVKIGPYAYKGNQWVGYDDVDMAAEKALYILDNELGGAMFWDLATDDFRGNCGQGKSPLISTVRDVLKKGACPGESLFL